MRQILGVCTIRLKPSRHVGPFCAPDMIRPHRRMTHCAATNRPRTFDTRSQPRLICSNVADFFSCLKCFFFHVRLDHATALEWDPIGSQYQIRWADDHNTFDCIQTSHTNRRLSLICPISLIPCSATDRYPKTAVAFWLKRSPRPHRYLIVKPTIMNVTGRWSKPNPYLTWTIWTRYWVTNLIPTGTHFGSGHQSFKHWDTTL